MEIEKNDSFRVLVVESNTIEEYDWADVNYISNILNTKYCSYNFISNDNNKYLQDLGLLLKYYNYNQPLVESHIISIDKNYIYEIIYMVFEPENEDINKMKPNAIGMLFDLQGDPIFNNIILMKYYNPIDGSPKKYEDITKKDLEHLMYKRIYTTVVVYEDDNFREEEIPGPIEDYAKIFFEGDEGKIKKKELVFLKNNINIWYLEDEFGESNVCGKLIDNKIKIFKCLFFSKLTEDRRNNLTLEEVDKIIYLSNILEDFTPKVDEKIEGDKKLLKNRYEILWETFENNKK